MDTKGRKAGVTDRVSPARRPYRTQPGVRHTALAAKIHLEKPEMRFKRGPQNFFRLSLRPPFDAVDRGPLQEGELIAGAVRQVNYWPQATFGSAQ
jgi:hypothetical protein